MQKKIIALAIAGMSSVAFAQSNVTISGAIEAHYENVSASGATAANGSLASRARVADNTSWLRFAGSEKLGNGMTAFFQVESDLAIDNASGAALGNRNSAVGLSGNWGTVLMGHWDAHYQAQLEGGVDFGSSGALAHSANSMNLTSTVSVAALAGAVGFSAGAGNAVIGGRLSNVVAYITPDFSGFSARLAYSTGSENTTNGAVKDHGRNLFVKYANGPINAFWSNLYASENSFVGATGGNAFATTGLAGLKVNADKLGFAYTLPMGLKLGIVYDNTKISLAAGLAAKRTAWSLPISYTTGAHGVYFAYAKAGDYSNAAGSVANTGAKNVILGYTYALSKRTGLGVSYSAISNDSAANYDFWTRGVGMNATSAGADPKSFAVGINHSF